MTTPQSGTGQNRILSRLLNENFARLQSKLKSCSFESGEVLYKAHEPIDFVYFPYNCVLSAVTMLKNGDGIEVGTIGNEGAAGLTAFLGPTSSPHRMFVQVPGEGSQISASVLQKEADANRTLYDLLLRHHEAFIVQISQSAACNGLHPLIQRCCRWLLMTHDRMATDELPLTHEFLSFMLAVRRPGVTEALQSLESQGLIENTRGVIKIINRRKLEAAACECYGMIVKEYKRLIGSE